MQGGYSVPCNESVMKAKERLRKDIEDGKYCLGEAIVPKEYKKMVIKNRQVTAEIFTIYGRKIPLMEIRKKLLQNEVKYMRDPPDFDNLEPTELMKIFQDVIGKPVESVSEAKKELQSLSHTRHLQVWHNNSTIAMTLAHNLRLGNKKEVIISAQYAQSKQHRHIVYELSFLLK